jgi:hypothetical protein
MSESAYHLDDGILAMLEGDPKGGAREVFEHYAGVILAYAQDNAPWGDRTGAARAGLGVVVEELEGGGAVGLSLYHSVDYGYWLEVIQSGRFAVIMPTLEMFAPQVFEAAGGKVTGMGETI